MSYYDNPEKYPGWGSSLYEEEWTGNPATGGAGPWDLERRLWREGGWDDPTQPMPQERQQQAPVYSPAIQQQPMLRDLMSQGGGQERDETPDTSLFVPLGDNQIAPQLSQRLSDLLDKQDEWKPYIPQSQRKSRFEYERQ